MADDFNHPFFLDGSAPVPDGWVDPDLADGDPDTGLRSPAASLVLVALAGLALFFAWQSFDIFRYAMSERAPIELGLAEELRETSAHYSGHRLVLSSNRHAQIEGVTERRTAAGERVFRKLIGAHIYIETRDIDDRPVVLRDQPRRRERGTESLADYYGGSGRLVAFSDLPRRYESIVRYYSTNFRVEFCGYPPAIELQQWQNNQRSRIELSLLDSLGRDPTPAELDAALGDSLRCHEGYLLFDGVTPANQWYWLVIYLLLLGIVGGALWFLWQTVAQQRASGAKGTPTARA